jgi:O-antigen/teichoic acid export membrane protein
MAYAFSEACASAATVFAYSVASLVCIPSQSESKARVGFTTESYRICAAFVAQDFLKLALSESEKLVVVSRSPDREQGGFGLASNLGSLFARIALKPIEDSASSTFSSSAHDLHSKASLLQSTMRILFSASLLLAIVAQPFVQIGLHILYGPVWAAEPSALRGLRAYCAYIPFLAFNGVIEAYADALLSVRAITERNISLVLATALQVALQLVLEPHFGVIGIICVYIYSLKERRTSAWLQFATSGTSSSFAACCCSNYIHFVDCTLYSPRSAIVESNCTWYARRICIFSLRPELLRQSFPMV